MAVAAAKHRRGGKKKQPPLPNFEVGDFVLEATVADVGRGKLQVVWKGPMRITGTKGPWVIEVEDLVTKKVSEVHVSRLRFYADKILNVTDLLCQVAYCHEGHEARSKSFSKCVVTSRSPGLTSGSRGVALKTQRAPGSR
jgi:hypothetical protein